MGRKAAPAVEEITGQFIAVTATPAPIAAQINAAHEQQQLAVAKYGDGLPWHPDHYTAAIRHELHQGFEALLRAGRYLIVTKTCTAHGEWQRILDDLGLSKSHAQRMMEAARRTANLPPAGYLIAAAGNQSKFFELLTLDDSELQSLADGDEVAGITLDDVEQMTRQELRTALRESREDIAAKNDRLAKKEEALERKEKTIRALKKEFERATPEETTAQLREVCTRAALTVRSDIDATGDVASMRMAFDYLFQVDDGKATRTFLGGLIGEAMVALRALRDAYGLPIINDDAQA